MIYYNSDKINDWNFGDDNIIKVYRNNAVCYYKVVSSGGTTSQTPCYAVVDDISLYEDTEFEDVFNKADEKWYKLNNLNEYEEYGIYGSGRTITTYEGKLTVDDGYEYIYSGSSWVNVGEVSGGTIPDSYIIEFADSNVKTICVNNWGGNVVTGEITYGEAKQVTSLGAVFARNTGITSFNELAYFTGLQSISNGEFVGCKNLTDIVIPSNVTTLGTNTSNKWIFSGCTNLSGVTILSGDESLYLDMTACNGSYYMSSSHQNTPMVFPNRTITMGSSAFAYCDYLTQAYFQSSTPPINLANSDINNYRKLANVYCPVGSLSDYQTALAGKNKTITEYDFETDSLGLLNKEKEWISKTSSGSTVYPLYYQEKQDPPQSVSFSSMTEAEEYECPYVGLDADIDGTDYIFDDNYNWVTKYGLFEVSGYVCDSGDKYQKMEEKVRNVDDTWSSQDPPVYEKGDLIESGSTDCSCRLPNGYTEIEYIENTSTAYINLGVKLNQTLGTSYSISTKIYSEYLSSGFGYLIGDEGTSSPYNGMCLRWNTGRLECVFVPTTDGTYVNVPNSDGTSAITISSEGVTQTNNVDLSLFCGIWSSGPWRNGKGRIYTFSLTMNNELVRDLVPAKRDSDNVVGLYDLVNDTFYTSPNGVSFVGGAVVPCRRYDAEIEYLESSGSQYINTGVYLNTSNFEIGYEIVGEKQLYGYCHQGMTNGTWLGAEQGAYVFFGKNNLGVTITSYLTSGNNTVVFTQSGVTVNGNSISKSLSMGSDNISNIPLLIYARYDFKTNDIEYRTDSYSKFKSFYVKNNGTLVLDLIPVRVGQVGYMYDRVNQQLFGNDGSGSFILGLDKIS